jgi:hypothetical protein
LHTESASTFAGFVHQPFVGWTIAVMNVVVERGLARCPRCAASADYCFIECGTEAIRYEIECRSCGELYCEENSTSPTAFRTEELWVPPAPAADPVPGTMARLITELRRWSDAALPMLSKLAARVRAAMSSVPPLR